jgi:GPH family glycoside/pentoside/hexuronide:cation symporter
MEPRHGHELSFGEQLIYASGSFGSNIMSRMRMVWLLYFYAPPEDADLPKLAPVVLVGVMLTIGRLIEALDDPLIGHWSDRTRTRWGRRIPFVVLATPFYALFFVLLWLPPVDHESALNALYLFVVIEAFHLFGTLSGGPFEALLPEIAPDSRRRMTIVTWQVLFGALGAGFGLVVTAPLVDTIGFWQTATIVAVLSMASRYFALFGARRSMHIEQPPAEIGFLEAVRDTFENDQFRAFWPTFGLYSAGVAVLLGALPYFVDEVLDRSEGFVGVLTAGAIVLVVACLPLIYRLSETRGKAWVYATAMLIGAVYMPFIAFAGYLPGIPQLAQAVVMIALVGVPMAAVYTFPNAIMADVIDYDAVRTGMRREAIYYGTQNLMEKIVDSVAPLVLALLLLLGSTGDNPLGIRLAGPVAGLFLLAGYLSFRGYRLPDHVTAESVAAMEAEQGETG